MHMRGRAALPVSQRQGHMLSAYMLLILLLPADLHGLGGHHPVRLRHLLPVCGAGRQLARPPLH